MSTKDRFTLRPNPHSGIFYVHWTEPVARGKPGRSRRITTHTTEIDQAKRFRARLLLSGGVRERPVTKCPFCIARANSFLMSGNAETSAPQAPEADVDSKPIATSTVADLWAAYAEKHIKRNVA